MKQSLNHKEFVRSIKTKRLIDNNFGVREASKEIGISSATLSRCENARMPDLITYVNICKWLNVPMETFIVKSKKI